MRITCKHFIFIPRRGLDGRFRARHISRFSRPSPLVAVLSLRSSIVVKWSRRLFLLCWARAYRTLSAAWNCLIPTGTPCAWKRDGWMALCSEAPRILNCIGNRFADLIQNQTLIKLWTCKKQYSFTQSHCVSINVSDAHFVVSYSVRSMVMAKLELTSTIAKFLHLLELVVASFERLNGRWRNLLRICLNLMNTGQHLVIRRSTCRWARHWTPCCCLHGSHHHQCMNLWMNYWKSLWTKASDKCKH